MILLIDMLYLVLLFILSLPTCYLASTKNRKVKWIYSISFSIYDATYCKYNLNEMPEFCSTSFSSSFASRVSWLIKKVESQLTNILVRKTHSSSESVINLNKLHDVRKSYDSNKLSYAFYLKYFRCNNVAHQPFPQRPCWVYKLYIRQLQYILLHSLNSEFVTWLSIPFKMQSGTWSTAVLISMLVEVKKAISLWLLYIMMHKL